MRDGLGTPRRRWLLALSMGGMVAHAWLGAYPGEVAGAVLINSSLGGASPPWRRMRPGGAVGAVAAALARRGLARERALYELTSGRPERAAEVLPGWVQIGERRPVRAVTGARQLLAALRYRPRSLAAPRPVLVLASAGDRLVHPGCSEALARALGAPLRVHPTAGHDLPLDDPAWVVEAVRSWRDTLLQV